MKFRNGLVLLIIAVFLAGMVSGAYAQAGALRTSAQTESIAVRDDGNTNVDDGVTVTAVNDYDAKIRLCVDFLTKNRLDSHPKLMCGKLLNKEVNCVAYLKSKEISDPTGKCERLFADAGATVENRVAVQNTAVSIQLRERVAERLSEENPDAAEIIDSLPEGKSEVFAMLPRAEQKKILEMNEEQRTERLGQYTLVTVNKNAVAKKRMIAKAKLNAAEQNYEKAKNEYERVNRLYKQKKELFEDAKDKLEECEGEDTDECNELRELAEEHAKDYITNGALMAIEHLKKIKNKVESSDGMDEEEAAEIIAHIDETIAELEEAIDKVEAAETKEDVKDAAKDVAEAWKKIKHAEKVYAEKVVNARMYNIIKKSEQLEKRLEHALQRIEEKGTNIDGLNEKVDEFSAKIVSAKEKHDAAVELLKQASDLKAENPEDEQVRELAAQAKEKLGEAQDDIKEAYRILTSIIKDIRASGGDIEEDDDDDEDEVEVVEAEDDDEDEVEEEEEEESEDDVDEDDESDETTEEEEDSSTEDNQTEEDEDSSVETNETDDSAQTNESVS